jgi:hypothetical protein
LVNFASFSRLSNLRLRACVSGTDIANECGSEATGRSKDMRKRKRSGKKAFSLLKSYSSSYSYSSSF